MCNKASTQLLEKRGYVGSSPFSLPFHSPLCPLLGLLGHPFLLGAVLPPPFPFLLLALLLSFFFLELPSSCYLDIIAQIFWVLPQPPSRLRILKQNSCWVQVQQAFDSRVEVDKSCDLHHLL